MDNKVTLLLALIVAIALAGIHHVSKEMPSPEKVDRVSRMLIKQKRWRGKFAPDFELELFDGRTFRLADAVGEKVVVINFFTTWCGPCREEMPELNRFFLKHREDPVIMIGIDGDEKAGKVKEFCDAVTVSFPVGIDAGERIMKDYGVEAFPTTIMIDPRGKVVLYEEGVIANTDVSLDPFLSEYFSIIEEGTGIDRSSYLGGERNEDYNFLLKERGALSGRGLEISERIYCPCGRDRLLAGCHCPVARRMKKDLLEAIRTDKTDEEIIADLSRKYSVVRP